ncbi:hypothetical protein H310_10438 [Aphanomyces invadans]|uniref:Transposase Tc1-like domain-containing protein n=1 Tax=Aphanomyces invadans TaxID=157072 RepID=A0A024TQH7_9STRA|nr:hypothetical protein H310_10438 [Aphanomyces invadans]ETV96259.1 hypothetical protein H310_10438 [Aphanomyces invadans]|eukprot:XP_008875051.1 hypothetical protein H310_10438 [Aphanomyces invadans]
MDVVFALQDAIQEGKLRRGAKQDTAARFDIGRATIRKIWHDFKRGTKSSKKKVRVGPKPRCTPSEIREMIQAVPEQDRSTFRDMANTTGISKSILARHFKAGTIERRSTRLKPFLTKDNRLKRLAYCGAHVKMNLESLTHLNPCLTSSVGEVDAISEDAPVSEVGTPQEFEFSDLFDVVHLDVKWFNEDKDKRKTYVVPSQDPARCVCKSKPFVPKVMFLAGVARPRPEEGFDGKIGTMVMTLVNVDGATYRDFVLHQVVPAIKSRFPSKTKRVILQHDNATPHATIDDGVLAEVSTDNWVFMVRRQPPNSPDLNVLDLGYFASIQALQYKTFSRSVDDVIGSTLCAFEALSVETLGNVFLILQAAMRQVLEHEGNNDFKIPHMKKDTLRRCGSLMANFT